MKILWRFDTESHDEMMEMNRCLHATDAFVYIWDILHNSKKSFLWKIEAGEFESQEDVVEAIYQMLWQRLEDKGINLEKLIE